jgi:hypothetical protein
MQQQRKHHQSQDKRYPVPASHQGYLVKKSQLVVIRAERPPNNSPDSHKLKRKNSKNSRDSAGVTKES